MNYDNKRLIKKSSFTIFIILVNLLFINIPVFGVNSDIVKQIIESYSSLSFTNDLTGNALGSLSMGAFAVSSIVTANIFLTVLTFVFKKLEQLQDDGEYGRLAFQKLNTVLALILTIVMSAGFLASDQAGIFIYNNKLLKIIPIIQWSMATLILSYLSNKMQDNGVGQGMSVLICSNIALKIPDDIKQLLSLSTKNMIIIAMIILFVVMVALYINSAVIKIPLIQSNKTKTSLNEYGHLPITTSVISVMPIIYTVMIINTPMMIKNIFNINNQYFDKLIEITTPQNWYSLAKWYYVLGFVIYIALVYVFSEVSAKMNFSAGDITNRLREQGDIIPGINPGENTKKYLKNNVTKICRLSFILLMIVAILPDFVIYQIDSDVKISLLGTSLIIIISVFYDVQMRLKALTRHLDKKYDLF